MRLNSKWLMVLFLLAVFPLSGCGFVSKLQARNSLNKGVKAFTDQKYDAAAQFFEKTIELDPDFEVARMYLATSYTSQFIPGSTDPKSLEMANKGLKIFEEVVAKAKDPAKPNKNAMLSLASLYYQLKEFDKSKFWCNRTLKVYPDNAEAYYRIAVMDYEDSFEKTGMQGDNVGDLNPEVKTKMLTNIEEGLAALGKALEIRPDYFDAMLYQNLLWREKSKFEKDPKVKAELSLQADKLYQKALALQLKAQADEAARPKKLGNIGKK
jgi:tetratricopeptide (TPR) repeat protein